MTTTPPVSPIAPQSSAALLSNDVVQKFLGAAMAEYQRITAEEPRPCFGALLGTVVEETVLVTDVAFGKNVRTSDPTAREEFETSIVPRFGPAYENPVRGWWFAPSDLLGIARGAEARGLDVFGSIHLHPDWHRLGPESAREHRLSDRPTPMDEYMFRRAGWPLNVVCYLEKQHGGFYYSLAAWGPDCGELPLRVNASAGKEYL